MATTRRVRRMGVRGEKRVHGGEISPRRAALGRLLKALGAVAGGLLLRARFFFAFCFFAVLGLFNALGPFIGLGPGIFGLVQLPLFAHYRVTRIEQRLKAQLCPVLLSLDFFSTSLLQITSFLPIASSEV
ncbi:hypothetical protein V6Z11_D01G039500 [Gossypium hirsutum]